MRFILSVFSLAILVGYSWQYCSIKILKDQNINRTSYSKCGLSKISIRCITFKLSSAREWTGSRFLRISFKSSDETKCIRNGTEIPFGGETIKIPSVCEECSCNANSGPNGETTMGCCAYGIHAGMMLAAPGCKIIADIDGCTPKMVHIDDESKPC